MPGSVHCDDQGVEFRLAQTVRFNFTDLVDFDQNVDIDQALLFFNENTITDLVFTDALDHQTLLQSVVRVLTAYLKAIIKDIRTYQNAWVSTGLDLTVCLEKLQCVKNLLIQLNSFASHHDADYLDSKLGLRSWIDSLERVQARLNRLWGQRSSLSTWVRRAGLIWNSGSDYLTYQSSVRDQGRLDRIVFDLLSFFDLHRVNAFIEQQTGAMHFSSVYGFDCIELHANGKRKPVVLWDSVGRLTCYYSIPVLSLQRLSVIEELNVHEEQQTAGEWPSKQKIDSWCEAYRSCYQSACHAANEEQTVGNLLQTLLSLYVSLQLCPGASLAPAVSTRAPFLPFYISQRYGVSWASWQQRYSRMELHGDSNSSVGLKVDSI